MPGRNTGQPKPLPLRNRAGVSLPEAVRVGVAKHRNCCPCCTRIMTFEKLKRGFVPKHKATVGHDFSVARGGDPGRWFWQCSQCNNEQGSLDLVTWTRKLVYADDPRAPLVEKLAAFIGSWVAALEEEEAAREQV